MDKNCTELNIIQGPDIEAFCSSLMGRPNDDSIINLEVEQEEKSFQIKLRINSITKLSDTRLTTKIEAAGHIWGGDCENWMRNCEFKLTYDSNGSPGHKGTLRIQPKEEKI